MVMFLCGIMLLLDFMLIWLYIAEYIQASKSQKRIEQMLRDDSKMENTTGDAE